MIDIKHNGSGYRDPTAHEALKSVIDEEKHVRGLIKRIKAVTDICGYTICNMNFEIKNKRSGKVWRYRG